MADEPNCTWIGASGQEYEYDIYRPPLSIEPGQNGNYIHARRYGQGRWVPVYIGEGDLAQRASDKHPRAACIAERGATHFHCHRNSDAEARRAEEQDLLVGHPDAYEPVGCNEQQGVRKRPPDSAS